MILLSLEPFRIVSSIYFCVLVFNFILMLTKLGPSGSPQSLSTLVTGTTTANVSWSPPDISTQNGPIISYTVVITDLSFGMADQGLNSTVLHQFISGLEEYGNYSVRVAASTVEGLGPYSAPVTFITLEDSKPFQLF